MLKLSNTRVRLDEVESDREALLSSYQELVGRNETRMDTLISKQEEILDQRLGLGQNSSPGEQKAIRPLGRKSWSQTAAKFEADRRQEYWKKQNEKTAERDKKTIGETKSGPDRPT